MTLHDLSNVVFVSVRLVARILWRLDKEGSVVSDMQLTTLDELEDHINDMQEDDLKELKVDVHNFLDYWPRTSKQHLIDNISHIFGVVCGFKLLKTGQWVSEPRLSRFSFCQQCLICSCRAGFNVFIFNNYPVTTRASQFVQFANKVHKDHVVKVIRTVQAFISASSGSAWCSRLFIIS